MPTLEEIAQLANASRSTVSRVINNDPNVSAKTRQRVLDVIREVNYQPNRAARSLAGGQTRVLGLVTPIGVARLFNDPFFPLLIQGVTTTCNANDYSVMLWMTEPDYEDRLANQILYNGLIDGVIVSSALVDDALVQALLDSPLPFILVGRHPNEEGAYVDVDNKGGAQSAINYLARQGRRRIATIYGPQTMVVGIDRLLGYRQALRERGLPFDPELTVPGDFTETGGYEATQRLMPHQPDAIFAASDMMALGALRALREAGLSVPGDVALIGFDDIPLAERTEPALTTIRQPIQRMGVVAAETLIDWIENPENPPTHIVLPTELVIRQTV